MADLRPYLGWGFAGLTRELKEELDSIRGQISDKEVRAGTVTLNGTGALDVVFGASRAASVTGTQTETFDLTGVGTGGTLIVTPDGGAAQTATFNFTAGYHTGGTGAATDLSGETDNKFMIAVDGDVDSENYHEIALTNANCTTGATTATEMQTQIQALAGIYASVTVSYDTDHYVITSGTSGSGSKVRIERAASNNVTEELKIGPDGGTNTDGTGDVANAAAVTATEVVTVVNAAMMGLTAEVVAGAIRLVSDTTGSGSSLAIGSGTLNTVLGFTADNTYYGGAGLGYDTNMADANYWVAATLSGVAQADLAGKNLSVANKTSSGFTLNCESSTATDNVDLIIFGRAA